MVTVGGIRGGRSTSAAAGPPSPRRVRLDGIGWEMVREAAADDDLDVSSLPQVPGAGGDRDLVRQTLVDRGILDPDHGLADWIAAGLAVLTTGPVTVGAQRTGHRGRVTGSWATMGTPTAGVVVREVVRTPDAASTDAASADAAPEHARRVVEREVELQLLTAVHLVAAVMDVVRMPLGAGHAEGPAIDVSVATQPDDLPDQLRDVVVDGDVAARAVVDVVGPRGATTAMLVGDGETWWQVGATGPDSVRWIPIDAGMVRASLTSTLSGHLSDLAVA